MTAKLTAKLTPNQQKILDLLQQIATPISAQSIYLELRQRQQSLGIATVYRALDSLKLRGMIRSQVLIHGECLYSPLRTDQHHLNCLQCGQSTPIQLCPIADPHPLQVQGFQVFYHTLEFFGLCQACQASNP
ncbi:MAG: Fur family transcriptional regulator [Pseudanabaenaceae cyanobacterium bins.68]|nr:Fur family transcriptional regulator [Pseudanabaenaceae cyanobacterium bins.68]